MDRAQLAPDRSEPAADVGGVGCPSRSILGMRVDGTTYAETIAVIESLARDELGGAISVATVHMVMEGFDDPDFQAIVNASDRVTPDGVPLVWALRALGVRGARRVYGPTLMPQVCALAAERGLPVGFYGGTSDVLEAMIRNLNGIRPALQVSFAHAPPFRAMTSDEDAKIVDEIEASGIRILFVGLGCPKQERWIAEHRSLSCVLVGVGAAFDFQAGHKPQAPAWLQRAGLEWLFRLVTEPRRLWRRYLYHNPRFVFHFARALFRRERDTSRT